MFPSFMGTFVSDEVGIFHECTCFRVDNGVDVMFEFMEGNVAWGFEVVIGCYFVDAFVEDECLESKNEVMHWVLMVCRCVHPR